MQRLHSRVSDFKAHRCRRLWDQHLQMLTIYENLWHPALLQDFAPLAPHVVEFLAHHVPFGVRSHGHKPLSALKSPLHSDHTVIRYFCCRSIRLRRSWSWLIGCLRKFRRNLRCAYVKPYWQPKAVCFCLQNTLSDPAH